MAAARAAPENPPAATAAAGGAGADRRAEMPGKFFQMARKRPRVEGSARHVPGGPGRRRCRLVEAAEGSRPALHHTQHDGVRQVLRKQLSLLGKGLPVLLGSRHVEAEAERFPEKF